MKKLKIKEIKDERGIVTHIQVEKQTHIQWDFGDKNDTFRHNDFMLSSCSCPEIVNDRNYHGLFVRGDEEHRDDDILEIPSQEWLAEMRSAVAAYNKCFRNCNDCTDRHCNNCEVGGNI